MKTCYVYILICCDGTYYTGSTNNLQLRMEQHYNGLGANYTAKRLPVKLQYIEKFDRIDIAFQREKQIQGWSHRKKKALIERNYNNLKEFAKSYKNI